MTEKILFLDIDGVLNDHERHDNGFCGIKPSCVAVLNRVLELTECQFVISSAWRYLIHSGSMTREGFENLLLTHGVNCKGRIIGITRRDANISDKHERGKQISDWLRDKDVRYVVVDDDDEIGIPEAGHPFVKTNGKIGLTEDKGDEIVRLLNAGEQA